MEPFSHSLGAVQREGRLPASLSWAGPSGRGQSCRTGAGVSPERLEGPWVPRGVCAQQIWGLRTGADGQVPEYCQGLGDGPSRKTRRGKRSLPCSCLPGPQFNMLPESLGRAILGKWIVISPMRADHPRTPCCGLSYSDGFQTHEQHARSVRI